jgi:hypothetical protein
MSVWLTEREFRRSGAAACGVTINVPFLREIKQDNLPVRQQTQKLTRRLIDGKLNSREAVELLSQYRDGLETYFSLEEFYGYFKNAAATHPTISMHARELSAEHESLFLQLNSLIDLAEQIVYHECDQRTTLKEVADSFADFADQFESHEQREMELMMRLCNEDFGVGD